MEVKKLSLMVLGILACGLGYPCNASPTLSLSLQSESTPAKQMAILPKKLPDMLILTQPKETPTSLWLSSFSPQFFIPKATQIASVSPLIFMHRDSAWEAIKPIRVDGLQDSHGVLIAPKGTQPGTMVFPFLFLTKTSHEAEARIIRWVNNVSRADPQTPIVILGPFKGEPPVTFSSTQTGEYYVWTNIAGVKRSKTVITLGST